VAVNRIPHIVPYLYVDDFTGYLEFLCEAFGFETRGYDVMPGHQWYCASHRTREA
jgi:hypothetical protein